jgi:hypothetical protein
VTRLQNGLYDVEAGALPLWVVTRDPVEILKAGEDVQHLSTDDMRCIRANENEKKTLTSGVSFGLSGTEKYPRKESNVLFWGSL